MARRLDNWMDSDFLMLRDLNIAITRILYGLYGLYGGSWRAVINDRTSWRYGEW
jgi:hypothetical protein